MESEPTGTPINFVCISDTHNKADQLQMPKGDVLLHSGDFTLGGLPEEVAKFNDFLRQAPYEVKIVIAGNHDLTFDLKEYNRSLARAFHSNIKEPIDPVKTKALLTECVYLEDSSYKLKGYNIYGSPYTPTFFDWGFNLDIGEPLRAKWAQIPRDTDILLTHGPPYGILDRCYDGVLAGCPDLKKVVLEEVKPLYHIFGHIHEAYGQQKIGSTTFINPSSLNFRYKSGKQPPICFSLPSKEVVS